MEVVCPVGMFVYTAVHKLAADGAVFDTHEKKSMVRGTPKRKPRYLISRFMFSFMCATHTRYARTIKGNIPIKKKKKRDTCIQQCTPLAADGQVGVGFSVGW